MNPRRHALTLGLVLGLVLAGAIPASLLTAADTRQEADSLAKKIAIINQHAERGAGAARRTPVSEGELNSWFTYRARPLLPRGVTSPKLTIIGNGKVMGLVTVDLEEVGRQRSSGGMIDPWSLLGGRVPVSVTGVLRTDAGRGRFDLQDASVGGVPVPKALLQELVSYYSKTDERPDGVRLDAPFALPAGIKTIEVGQAQAVVVQ